jgi:hypothetical protein
LATRPGIPSLAASLLGSAIAISAASCPRGAPFREALFLDGSVRAVSDSGCPSGMVCLEEGGCRSSDSLVARKETTEEYARFLRRGAEELMSRGMSATAAHLLGSALVPGTSQDSLRLELAQALFRSGRYEAGLEVNYGLDTAKGPLRSDVLAQRRDFFSLLGMPEEAAKVDVQLLELPVEPEAKPANSWVPKLRAGWSFSSNRMSQDGADTSSLQSIQALLANADNTGSNAVALTQDRIQQTLTRGYSQDGNASLAWSWFQGDWSAALVASGSLALTSDLSDMRSYEGDLDGQVSRNLGPFWLNLDLDLGATRYTGSTLWWNRNRSIGLSAFRSLDSGSLTAAVKANELYSPDQPDGAWDWQASLVLDRKVPRAEWLEVRPRAALDLFLQPSIDATTPVKIDWCSGLDSTKSTLSSSVVHYTDSTGTQVEPTSFAGNTALTYHPGGSLLLSREVQTYLSPSLGLDLTAHLPAGFALTAGGSVKWIRYQGNVVWSNTKGAMRASDPVAGIDTLVVWKDIQTGKEYVFASDVYDSPLKQLVVQQATQTDLQTAFSLGAEWTSKRLGTFSAGTDWSWAYIDPYELDPTSRYRTWGWTTSWSRSW